jgi:hypothetical protein
VIAILTARALAPIPGWEGSAHDRHDEGAGSARDFNPLITYP